MKGIFGFQVCLLLLLCRPAYGQLAEAHLSKSDSLLQLFFKNGEIPTDSYPDAGDQAVRTAAELYRALIRSQRPTDLPAYWLIDTTFTHLLIVDSIHTAGTYAPDDPANDSLQLLGIPLPPPIPYTAYSDYEKEALARYHIPEKQLVGQEFVAKPLILSENIKAKLREWLYLPIHDTTQSQRAAAQEQAALISRLRFLASYIDVKVIEFGVSYHFHSYPIVHTIVLSRNLLQAQIWYDAKWSGGIALLEKQNGQWIKRFLTQTYVE